MGVSESWRNSTEWRMLDKIRNWDLTDRGLSDEGEPWFVSPASNEEVTVHFARIGGEYVVVSNFTEAVFRGRNFQALVRELLDSHCMSYPGSVRRDRRTFSRILPHCWPPFDQADSGNDNATVDLGGGDNNADDTAVSAHVAHKHNRSL